MTETLKLVQSLVTELEAYITKPTKANSLRTRKLTQQLNNEGPAIRKKLVELDKAGYNA